MAGGDGVGFVGRRGLNAIKIRKCFLILLPDLISDF